MAVSRIDPNEPLRAETRAHGAALTFHRLTRPVAETSTLAAPKYVRRGLMPTVQLLAQGGDSRIAIDPLRGLNKYGCATLPDPQLLGFGSSTASTISAAGFAAAEKLRRRLLRADRSAPRAVTYGREMHRLRRELIGLCGLADLPGLELIFAASGTDLHLLAAQLVRAARPATLRAVMIDPAETGSGVAAALAGRHFSNRGALGDSLVEGMPIGGSDAIEIATLPIRAPDGTPRPSAIIDDEAEATIAAAVNAGRQVLLTLCDVSKTGMIAPSPDVALRLLRRWQGRIEVLVDACQFRLSPATLRAYLEAGCLVAVTGSKFLTGPTFAGALLVPEAVADQFRKRALPEGLRAYSACDDWPQGWRAAGTLAEVPNFGLLLRWEAAMEELRAFRAIPEPAIVVFLKAFARAVQGRLATDPRFAALPVPRLDRGPVAAAAGWDRLPTIFPFLLHHADGRPFSRTETEQTYRQLDSDAGGRLGLAPNGADGKLAARRCQFGQPVACGSRDGIPVSALRLCASARLVKAAFAAPDSGAAVIGDAMTALDKVALLVRAGVVADPA